MENIEENDLVRLISNSDNTDFDDNELLIVSELEVDDDDYDLIEVFNIKLEYNYVNIENVELVYKGFNHKLHKIKEDHYKIWKKIRELATSVK